MSREDTNPARIAAEAALTPDTAIPRTCGSCDACCTLPGVEVLHKPPCTKCAHSDGGCQIYPTRPIVCREYTCLWLDAGMGLETDRPEQIGIMFDRPADVQNHPDYAGIHAVCAREVWPGARQGARAAQLLTRLARSMVVRVTPHGEKTQLMGPPNLINLLVERAAARLSAE